MVEKNEIISLKRRFGLFLLIMFLFTGITTVIDFRAGVMTDPVEKIFMLVVTSILVIAGFILWIN